MKKSVFIILILISWSINAQEESEMEFKKISTKDSIELSTVFKKLLNAVENKNEKEFLKLTLAKIDCVNCKDDSMEMINYVSNRDLYNNEFKTFENSAVYKALKKRSFHTSCSVIKNYKPKNLPRTYSKDLILYEVWIQTYLPNEWAKGHEGQSNTFQFVKINNEYKLYGLSSIP